MMMIRGRRRNRRSRIIIARRSRGRRRNRRSRIIIARKSRKRSYLIARVSCDAKRSHVQLV